MNKFFHKVSPQRIIAGGFALLILLGSILLMLPVSLKDGVDLSYADALYTSSSAVCVTGLVTVDPGDTFTPFGQAVILVLIQAGGLGVATIGAGIMIAAHRRVDLKGRALVKESLNLDSAKGLVLLVKRVFAVTLAIELIGAVLSFFTLKRDFGAIDGALISIFHSVASFNNSGFDIFGGGQSLSAYKDDVYFNLVTAALIFLGGIGFPVIFEAWRKRRRLKMLSLNSKAVLSVSFILIAAGTVLLCLTEKIPLLGALFTSVSARTAGFYTYPLKGFSLPGLITVMALMFIGASSGSTGGGIKTGTFFVLVQGIRASTGKRRERAFKYSIPKEAFKKASVIALLGLGIVLTGTFLMCVLEPKMALSDALFEVVSAMGTVGLTTGVTPSLGTGAKLLSIAIMYTGRLGPLTVASLLSFPKPERIRYPEGEIAVG